LRTRLTLHNPTIPAQNRSTRRTRGRIVQQAPSPTHPQDLIIARVGKGIQRTEKALARVKEALGQCLTPFVDL
ncbi:hypothetical protein, partial [Propioniciclava tarda]|uniref:hypothetical protein n=1 Tax=Propioniciclava tarda TaxID=433330 RepID=UPI001C8F525D